MSGEALRRVTTQCVDADHDAALAAATDRHIDLRPFRTACARLLDQLQQLGENTQDEEAEARRIDVIDTLEGTLEATDCDQNMVPLF